MFVAGGVRNDEHLDVMADLGSGESDAFADIGVLLLELGVLGEDEIMEHFVDELLVGRGKGKGHVEGTLAKIGIGIFYDF